MNAAQIETNTRMARQTIYRHILLAISTSRGDRQYNALGTYSSDEEKMRVKDIADTWGGWLRIKLDGDGGEHYDATHVSDGRTLVEFAPCSVMAEKEINRGSAFGLTCARAKGWLITWAPGKRDDPAFKTNYQAQDALSGSLTAVYGQCVAVDGDWDTSRFTPGAGAGHAVRVGVSHGVRVGEVAVI